MKKYWKLATLAITIVLLLSVHYIQSVRATSEFLTLKFNTIRGDESLVQNTKFYGHYNESPVYMPATASLQGETTALQGLYVYEFFETFTPADLKPYVESYRSFMRGKVHNPVQFYEDNNRLLYVNTKGVDYKQQTNTITFEVAALSKKDSKELSFNVTTPSKHPFRWAVVEEVQVIDGNIYVILYTSLQNSNSLHLFIIDEAQQKVIDHQPIVDIQGDDTTFYTVQLLNDQSLASMTNFAYYTQLSTHLNEENSMNSTFELYYYDLQTKRSTPINMPEALQKNLNYITNTNDALYIVTFNDKDMLDLHTYTYADAQWTALQLEDSLARSNIFTYAIDDLLYITSGHDEHLLHIYNTKTGKLLYKGELTNNANNRPFYFQVDKISNK